MATKKKATPITPITIESVWRDVRKVFNVQLNSTVIQFTHAVSDDDIETLFPDNDASKVDSWLDEKFNAFWEEDDPTTENMVDACATVFTMALVEKVLQWREAQNDDSDEDDSDINAEFEYDDADLDAVVDGD